jgi:hypothetical protein
MPIQTSATGLAVGFDHLRVRRLLVAHSALLNEQLAVRRLAILPQRLPALDENAEVLAACGDPSLAKVASRRRPLNTSSMGDLYKRSLRACCAAWAAGAISYNSRDSAAPTASTPTPTSDKAHVWRICLFDNDRRLQSRQYTRPRMQRLSTP